MTQITLGSNVEHLNRLNLPNLLYIGDVPVESTVAGSALLYRLLQCYPIQKLHIIETANAVSRSENRLPRVHYQTFPYFNKRLLNSRFNKLYSSFLLTISDFYVGKLHKISELLNPEAILTVAHGFSWLIAATLAKKRRIPLHLIVHDDWSSFTPGLNSFKWLLNRKFGDSYRLAQSRLCVSPYMEEHYAKLYGMKGSVLYPSRAADSPDFLQPPLKIKKKIEHAKFAYIGSIHNQGQASTLASLASVLEEFSGELIIYSPLSKERISLYGLNRGNITIHQPILYKDLLSRLREEVDILFIPMNFEPDKILNMSMCFPSKLTDCTAVGLPLLIWGPPYCSAIRWAVENQGVAEYVSENNLSKLRESVKRLVNDSDYRQELAMESLNRGKDYFSHSSVLEQFYSSLISPISLT